MEGRKELERFVDVVDQHGEVLRVRIMDEFGREIPDPVPMAPPIGYQKQPSMVEIVRSMVRSERLRAEAFAQGKESFQEADDFDVPDDPLDPQTPYENDFDPPIRDMLEAGKQTVAEKKRAAKEAAEAKKREAENVKEDRVDK